MIWWIHSRYFEPSQPQRIIRGLKTNFNQSPSYIIHKLTYKSPFLKPQLSVKYFTKKQTQCSTLQFHRAHQTLSESQIYIHNFKMPTQRNVWNLLMFRGHTQWEPPSNVHNSKQDDQFYSAGTGVSHSQHRNPDMTFGVHWYYEPIIQSLSDGF